MYTGLGSGVLEMYVHMIWNGFRGIHSPREGFGVKFFFSVFILRPCSKHSLLYRGILLKGGIV